MKLVSDNDTPRGNKPEPEMAIPSPAVPASPPPLPANFKDYPQTIGEVRSEASNDAKDWSARDILINLLRQIDAGDIDPDKMVIVHNSDRTPGRVTYEYRSDTAIEAVGMLQVACMMIGGFKR